LKLSYETPASSTIPRLHHAEKLEFVIKILSLTNSAVDEEQYIECNILSNLKVNVICLCVPYRTYEKLWNRNSTLLMKAEIQSVVLKISPSSHLFMYRKSYGI
jgi:hypothetical protein